MGENRRPIRVRLLGGLVVEGFDERDLGSRKARLLLKRLALGRGRPVPADELIEVVWGDDPPTRPNDQLAVLVSRLRRTLGADALPHQGSGYAFVTDWVDLDELARRVGEAAQARSEHRLGAARAAAEAAVALARGDVLPGDEGAWLDGERAWATANVLRAHHLLAEVALEAGDTDAAAASGEAALLADPYDEVALRLLMRAHHAAGRPASGLAAYVRVRERLGEDLGVAPTAETERLHDELAIGAPSDAAPAEPVGSRPMLGRDRELAALDGALARADAGEAVGVVVRGEAGIGKSALVRAWREGLPPTVTVVHCTCDPLGRDLPLQPLIDGLARHLDALGPSAAEVLGEHRAQLAGLLGAPTTVEGATVTRDPDVGRAEMFAALLAAVSRLGEGPVVVIVEDVHLAGTSTFEWIAFAVRRGRRLLVITTTRSVAADAAGAVVVDVGPLAPEVAARIVVGQIAHVRAVDAVVARADGNPLFLMALASSPAGELPVTIQEGVDRQAAMLGEAATTLRTAAVVGDAIDLDLLADVLAAPARDVLADLEQACALGLLEERPQGLAFRHELVREALAAGVGHVRRALVHRDVARVLRARAGHDPLAVAVHARLAGESDLAVESFVAAAAAAMTRFDVDAALHHLDTALQLAPDATAHARRARVRLAILDLAGAEQDAAAAVRLGGGAPALEISAWIAYYRRRYGEARLFADAGAEQAIDPVVALSCRAIGARVRHGAGDLSGALALLEPTSEPVPASVRGVADVWLAHAKVHQGRPAEALEIVQRALLTPAQLAQPWAALHGRFARVLALGQLGRLEEALAGCDEMETARLEAGPVGERFVGIAANGRGWLLRNAGCLSAADESNEQALAEHTERSRLTESGLSEAYWVAVLDLIDGRLLADDADGAARRLSDAEGLDEWQGTMAWHQRQRLTLYRARLALLGGDPSRAQELAESVRTDAAARGARRYELLGAAWSMIADPNPDLDQAAGVIDGLQACARLEGWRLTAALADRLGVDQWRALAERTATAIVANAGDLRDQTRTWVDRFLTTPRAT